MTAMERIPRSDDRTVAPGLGLSWAIRIRRTAETDANGSLDLYLIKPTRYDDDGYPIQWWRSLVPSNSLASVAGLVRDALDRGVARDLGEVNVVTIDEFNTKVDIPGIVASARNRSVLVFLVGVQTNQFPRAMDMARPLRAAEIPVCVGGFHVSGPVDAQDPAARSRRGASPRRQLFRRRRGGRADRRGAA